MSTSTNSNENILYETYKNSGLMLGFIIPAILLNFVTNTGIFLNFSVIFVSIKCKSLRGCANFLLALISFYEVLHQIGHLLVLFISISGINFIQILTALKISLPSLFGQNAVNMAITMAAADRLFALVAPFFRKKLNKCAYLTFCTILTILYGAYLTTIPVGYANAHSDLLITGLLSDFYSGPHSVIWFMHNSILNAFAILFYFFIWILVKREQGVTALTNARLLKSLLAIVLVNICGYLVNMGLYVLIFLWLCPKCYENTLMGWQLSFINGILVNISAASNAPILYFTSTDYREAFNRHFPFLCRIKIAQNRVTAMNNKNIQSNLVSTTNNLPIPT